MVTLEGLEPHPDMPQMNKEEAAAWARYHLIQERRREVAQYYMGHVFRQHAAYGMRLGSISHAIVGGYVKKGHAGREVQDLEEYHPKYIEGEDGRLHRADQ